MHDRVLDPRDTPTPSPVIGMAVVSAADLVAASCYRCGAASVHSTTKAAVAAARAHLDECPGLQ